MPDFDLDSVLMAAPLGRGASSWHGSVDGRMFFWVYDSDRNHWVPVAKVEEGQFPGSWRCTYVYVGADGFPAPRVSAEARNAAMEMMRQPNRPFYWRWTDDLIELFEAYRDHFNYDMEGFSEEDRPAL